MENDVIRLVVPQFHSVTRSFSKKVNLERHVPGFKYEAEDFFASHNESVPVEEATPEKIREVSRGLFALAKADVEESVAERIRELRKAAGVATQPTGADYDAIKDLIEGIETAASQEDLGAIVEKIKAHEDLSEDQKEYLRSIVRKANAKLK